MMHCLRLCFALLCIGLTAITLLCCYLMSLFQVSWSFTSCQLACCWAVVSKYMLNIYVLLVRAVQHLVTCKLHTGRQYHGIADGERKCAVTTAAKTGS
ncbi:hypothetical protein COO60DRAFT_1540092 [Scenedesmus sp. NREL 46B-D3]|nr:hypothetical protein COO60DRAFT_1540092 [Scenedesmus sp. NREL 46B-D3]